MNRNPKREVFHKTSTGSSIRTVIFEDEMLGLECVNKDGYVTRGMLSEEAVLFMIIGFKQLMAGGGNLIKTGWSVVPPDQLVVTKPPKPENAEVPVPLWMAEELLAFLQAKAAWPPRETLIPTGSINAFREAVEKVKPEKP